MALPGILSTFHNLDFQIRSVVKKRSKLFQNKYYNYSNFLKFY